MSARPYMRNAAIDSLLAVSCIVMIVDTESARRTKYLRPVNTHLAVAIDCEGDAHMRYEPKALLAIGNIVAVFVTQIRCAVCTLSRILVLP